MGGESRDAGDDAGRGAGRDGEGGDAFDGLGRYRQEESLVDAAGNLVAQVPVDARAEVPLGPTGRLTVAGPQALGRALSESPMVHDFSPADYERDGQAGYGCYEPYAKDPNVYPVVYDRSQGGVALPSLLL